MQISWKGQSCFQILTSLSNKEQLRIVIDPFDDSIGFKLPSMEADVVLVSHDHFDHNNVKGVKGEPFVINNPGEYDVKGVLIQGISSFHDDTKGKERGPNIIYTIEAEDMRVCHLGDLGQAELESETIESIGNVDILLVPVGGTYTIDAKTAAKIVSELEPKIVIPMHYGLKGLKVKLSGVDEFLKVMGAAGEVAQPKFTVKIKDLPQEGTKVVVLES